MKAIFLSVMSLVLAAQPAFAMPGKGGGCGAWLDPAKVRVKVKQPWYARGPFSGFRIPLDPEVMQATINSDLRDSQLPQFVAGVSVEGEYEVLIRSFERSSVFGSADFNSASFTFEIAKPHVGGSAKLEFANVSLPGLYVVTGLSRLVTAAVYHFRILSEENGLANEIFRLREGMRKMISVGSIEYLEELSMIITRLDAELARPSGSLSGNSFAAYLAAKDKFVALAARARQGAQPIQPIAEVMGVEFGIGSRRVPAPYDPYFDPLLMYYHPLFGIYTPVTGYSPYRIFAPLAEPENRDEVRSWEVPKLNEDLAPLEISSTPVIESWPGPSSPGGGVPSSDDDTQRWSSPVYEAPAPVYESPATPTETTYSQPDTSWSTTDTSSFTTDTTSFTDTNNY